ncbi:hypothetical protein WV31_04015 [Magnetospirillum sp. ME-1]|uniref:hypothetical protein n=1 Tax=Magnetospirillum sp. ME-1 TaxID=1639348 RepID=UPI000A17A518|nr:hypothetical protein [Magnetospirillum sp. ME-1]ARJ64898.1 hypothetical protein WV31_04015 [Magnetospirillum sp. ME-1]
MILLCPALALGAERIAPPKPSDLPPIDPPGVWHTLTQDDATTDSKCIGKPVTPLCAVETIQACFTRNDERLCQIGKGPAYRPLDLGTGRLTHYIRYRVAGTAIITKANRNAYIVERMVPRIGDIVLELNDLHCRNSTCGPEGGPPTSYILRRWEHGWYAAEWSTPRW